MNMLLLKLGDTIQGEVVLDAYAGQIEILSFSHGISQSIVHGLMGRTGTIGPTHQDFTVSKYLDLASTGILNACDHGSVIPEVLFTLVQVDSDTVTPFWTVTLRNVIVSSVTTGGGAGDRPTESVTLNYTAIAWVYQRQTGTAGSPVTNSASWDLTTHTEIK